MTSAKRGKNVQRRNKLVVLFSAIAFSLSSRPGDICCCSVLLVCVFFVLFLPTAVGGVATFISRDSSKQKLAKDVSSWQPR